MEPERLRMVIAANIRRLAAQRKLTLPALADLAGVARGSFYRVVNCKTYVRVDTLAKVADALGIHPRQLVDDRWIA